MNRENFIKFLEGNNIAFTKVRFSEQSKYQKNNYKDEYVNWEAWVYKNNSNMGCLITQSDYESAKKQNDFTFLLECLK